MDSGIVGSLRAVEAEHARRANDPDLQAKVRALKRYQQRRLEWTYRDLIASPRYGKAAGFFLVDLYGPVDFQRRDREFARIVPKIEAIFPANVVATVDELARLHALSETLDSAMAAALDTLAVDPGTYARAWRLVACKAERRVQLEPVLSVGAALDRLAQKPWLHRTLKLMRGPARMADLSELQAFLERGLTCFGSMKGAAAFLAIIEAREHALMEALFEGTTTALDELPAA